MRDFTSLLALPASILTIILATPAFAVAEKPWPYNLPLTAKYFPEDHSHMERELQAKQMLAWKTPLGMRKLSDDPGEKFFFQDWRFDEMETLHVDPLLSESLRPRDVNAGHLQSNYSTSLHPPFLPLGSEDQRQLQLAHLLGRSILKRSYECPAGTTSCASIGEPNSCCQMDETCQLVTNTGNGPVGCCPSGTTCGDTIGECDTAQGYTGCPNSSNGGCCMPGWACQDVGCEFL